MKKTIFIISVLTLIILVSFSLSACIPGKMSDDIKDKGQTVTNASEGSDQNTKINEEEIQNDKASEDESEFDMLYNPPEGGSPENVGKIK